MRILLPLLWVTVAWAQQPSPATPPAVPSALRGVYQLINDFGNTARYAADNQKLATSPAEANRVVFMGDSITDGWGRGNNGSVFFPGKPYVNRGISGQTTAQMLLRFYPDVVALQPKAVVILAGTNDIGGNLGPVSLESVEQNLAAMADMSRANNIKVVLASLTPVCDYHRPQTATRPPEKILELNRWIKGYAASHHLVYLDYYSATVDDKGFFKAEITGDGLHPNAAGYEIMGPLAEKAIAEALGR
ncbi:MAG: SGNH/GDSL hydrolase family protein [Bryobacteraceae bacterium]